MKKIILILTIFFFVSISYSEERKEDIPKLEEREGIVYVIGEEKAYTGTFIGKYEEDKLHTIEEKNRKETIYYKGGKLRREIPYKNGIRDGIKKLYYPNGNLEMEIPYENGIKEGIEKLYYPSGELHRATVYSNKDVVKEVYYDKNGNIETYYEKN